MPSVVDTLAPRLTRELDDLEVRPGGHAARVRAQEIVVDGPRHLLALLRPALYGVLHTGFPEELDGGPPGQPDPALRAELAAAVPHRDTVVSARLTERLGGELLVRVDGSRVRVPEDRYLRDVPGSPDGVFLALPAARPALAPGFFLADGSRGRSRRKPGLMVYVNLRDPEAAVPAWAAILRCLEREGVPYRARVCSSPAGFPRHDALAVYLGLDGLDAVPALASSVAGVAGRGDSVSVFAARVAAGVAVGWQPPNSGPGASGVSFGRHRAEAVAAGLIAHALGTRPGSKAEAVAAALRAAGVDPAAPHRNLDSPPARR